MKQETYIPQAFRHLLTLAAIALAAVALPLAFTACGDDEEEITPNQEQPNGGEDPAVTPDPIDPALIASDYFPGTWMQPETYEGVTLYNYFVFNPEGNQFANVSDLTAADEPTEDTEYMYGTYAITPASPTDGRTGTLTLIYEDEETQTMQYRFTNRNSLVIEHQYYAGDGVAYHEIYTLTRADHTPAVFDEDIPPMPGEDDWEDTGEAPVGKALTAANNFADRETDFQLTPELSDVIKVKLAELNNGLLNYIIRACVEPIRMRYVAVTEPTATSMRPQFVFHIGESVRGDRKIEGLFSVGDYVLVDPKDVQKVFGSITIGVHADGNDPSKGYLAQEIGTLFTPTYVYQYTRLGHRGVYFKKVLREDANVRNDVNLDGWTLIERKYAVDTQDISNELQAYQGNTLF